jgi:hypothetical protein
MDCMAIGMSADGGRVVTVKFERSQVWDAPRDSQRAVAFAMALHRRPGAGCPSSELDPEIMRLIVLQVAGSRWAI